MAPMDPKFNCLSRLHEVCVETYENELNNALKKFISNIFDDLVSEIFDQYLLIQIPFSQ